MKAHIAIMRFTGSAVSKYQGFDTAQEADDHVLAFLGDFPSAFAATNPGGRIDYWMVDGGAKTLTHDTVGENADDKAHAVVNKKDEFRIEGLIRIGVEVSAWDTMEKVQLIASIWGQLGAKTAAQDKARSIYLFVKNDVPTQLDLLVDAAAVDAIDPTSNTPFGGGPAWPV